MQYTNDWQTNVWNFQTATWDVATPVCSRVALTAANLYCIQYDLTVIKIANQGKGASSTLSFKANDLKATPNGNIWYVSTTTTSGGYTVYKYDESTGTNTLLPGTGAVKVGPSPDGNAWIVNSAGTILKYDGSSWKTVSGATAKDIVVGSDGLPGIMTQTALYSGIQFRK